jgi:hypothetical protein
MIVKLAWRSSSGTSLSLWPCVTMLRPTEPIVRFGYTASEIANLSLLESGLSERPVAVLI